MPTTAYSYVRFSHPDQAKGDSLRRQTERAEEYCRRRGWSLDEKLSIRDLGVSAFRGANAAVGNFRKFLEGVKSGKVTPGSVLIVESFDRISRQGIDEGYDVVKSILKAGIRIVTLSPEREFDREATRGLSKGALEILLILERAAEESERKSDRVSCAWDTKRKQAGERIITRKLPSWIRERGGRLELIPEKAAIVRRVFNMARDGLGTVSIAKRLNSEKVPVIGRREFKGKSVLWSETNTYFLLMSRGTYGTLELYKGRRQKGKEPSLVIENYYPPVITREEYDAVRGIITRRGKCGRGRRGKFVNLFAGLLVDARDGGTLTYKHLPTLPATIRPTRAKYAPGVEWSSFPAAVFETAILERLREVKVEEEGGDDGAKRIAVLVGRLAEVDALVKRWRERMDDIRIVDTVSEKLAELNVRRKSIVAELEEAQRQAASPLSQTLGEIHTLADLLRKDNGPDMRNRLRSALRSSISRVTCLFFGHTCRRFAIAQVAFNGLDVTRTYFLWSRLNRKSRETDWGVESLRSDEAAAVDLNNPKAVKYYLEKFVPAFLGERPQLRKLLGAA